MIVDLFGNPFDKEPDKHRKRQVAPPKSHYRAKIDSLYFPEITKNIETTGPYNMPIVQPNYNVPSISATTPFDRIGYRSSNLDSMVILYLTDNRFASRLTHPWDYTLTLSKFAGVIGPDLSQYIDMDYALRISNCYWNKAITAYWQQHNVNMYPNVTWSLPDSYEYSVAGMPIGSVIAINSMGILKYHFSKGLWLKGYRFMVEVLQPILILRYGPKIPGEYEDLSLFLDNHELNRLRNGSKRQ